LTDYSGYDQMPAAFFEQYQPEALRISLRQHQRSTIFDSSDIEQSIWEHVMLNWKHYATADEQLVSFYMKRAAKSFANRQRIDHMYFTGAFIYTPKIVAAYLETCAWEPLDEVPDVDARVDLQEAFELLRESSPEQAFAVFRRYGLKEFDAMTETQKKNSRLGVDALAHRLNLGLRLAAESVELTSAGA
jgi:hypothetical protein